MLRLRALRWPLVFDAASPIDGPSVKLALLHVPVA
jgi:hypothetical protein